MFKIAARMASNLGGHSLMGRIQLLDDLLINKIAAGEVVERPASVVKELVENCLDAGATRITVELTEGGKKRILVADNGAGMDRDDAVLALTRHATSKIKQDEDLFNLSTMGFRGEALASIAAVSKFTLVTCEQGKTEGVRVLSEGGATPDITSWQAPSGTTITVEDLFFNVPVRAKFLKTANTEYGNVLELMQSLALAWPQVDFTLVHNGKEQLRAAAVASSLGHTDDVLRKRFTQIFKQEATTPMVSAAAEGSYGQISAIVSAPGVEKATARDIYMFVNGRFVKDKALRFAILRGYHSHLLRGKYPIVVMFLTLDPGLVDVNVHPSKTEVRLQFASELQGMIAMAIRDALRRAEWSAPTDPVKERSTVFDLAGEEASPGRAWASPVVHSHSSSEESSKPSRASWAFAPTSSAGAAFSERSTLPLQSRSAFGASLFGDQPLAIPNAQSEAAIPWRELVYLGSISDCYLLFSHGDRRGGARLLAVDQHAFHERVLYEKLCNNANLLKRSQSLLVPEVLTFSPSEIESLKECQQVMEANGFRLGFVANDTVEVLAVPMILAKADAEVVLQAFMRRADSDTPMETNVGLAHDMLSTMACHGAVRAGEALGEDELRTLLAEAQDVDFFHNCPHGRRVFRWWDEQQIGRWFDR